MSETLVLWIVLAIAAYLFYIWVDRNRWRDRIKITGMVMLNPGRGVDVVSEGDHQRALQKAARGADPAEDVEVVATLVPVPRRSEDDPAIIVKIGRDQVGYLPHGAEKSYLPVVRRLIERGKLGQCRASIVHPGEGRAGPDGDGTSLQGNGELDLVLRLDLAAPSKAIPDGALGEETSTA